MIDPHETATLEWWPDYGGDLFWLQAGRGGRRVSMAELGFSPSFQERATAWLESYDDARLPTNGPGDANWLATGLELLAEARAESAGQYVLVATEPYSAAGVDEP